MRTLRDWRDADDVVQSFALKALERALQLRDPREAAGQLLRLALVPLGHALARLPMGNIGRARVSAFAPMALRPEITPLIDEALATTAVGENLEKNGPCARPA